MFGLQMGSDLGEYTSISPDLLIKIGYSILCSHAAVTTGPILATLSFNTALVTSWSILMSTVKDET